MPTNPKQLVADAKEPHAITRSRPCCASSPRCAPAGRPSSMLDTIRVDYYGTPTPLNQVGNLAVPDPTLITLQPWDPSLLPAIEKAIRTSDLDLNPQNDGKLIRIPIPPLTEERRKNLVKRRPQARRGRHGSRSATCAATRTSTSRSCSRTTSSARTTRSTRSPRSRSSPTSTSSEIDAALKKKEAEIMEV